LLRALLIGFIHDACAPEPDGLFMVTTVVAAAAVIWLARMIDRRRIGGRVLLAAWATVVAHVCLALRGAGWDGSAIVPAALGTGLLCAVGGWILDALPRALKPRSAPAQAW
jgi:FtsH-binding integral membrane protein